MSAQNKPLRWPHVLACALSVALSIYEFHFYNSISGAYDWSLRWLAFAVVTGIFSVWPEMTGLAFRTTQKVQHRVSNLLAKPLPKQAVQTIPLAIALLGISYILWSYGTVISTRFSIEGGTRYWMAGDDPCISMRYAYNLVHGRGLQWNPGDDVEGFTNPLLVAIMAVVLALHVPTSSAFLWVMIVNAVLVAATVPFIISIVRRLGGSNLAILVAVAAFATNADLLSWSVQAMEQPLAVFLFSAALATTLANRLRPSITSAVLVGLLGLVRSDMPLLMATIICLWGIGSRDRKTLLAIIVASIPTVAYEFFRLAYYHSPFPNTYYLKATGWPGHLRQIIGAHYVIDFIRQYKWWLALATVGAFLGRNVESKVLAVSASIFLLAIAWIGGDAYPRNRFILPILPVVCVLGAIGWNSPDKTDTKLSLIVNY